MKFAESPPAARQLALAYGAMLAALTVMGVLVVINLMALQSANEVRNRENRLDRILAEAEFRLARQENSYRGFLLSTEPYYTARLETHRAEFRKAMEQARAYVPATYQGTIDGALQAADGWYRNVAVAGQALVAQGRLADAERLVGQTGMSERYLDPVETAIDDLRAVNAVALESSRHAQVAASRNALIAVTAGLASTILMFLLAGLATSRAIARSTFSMTDYLQKLRTGGAAI